MYPTAYILKKNVNTDILILRFEEGTVKLGYNLTMQQKQSLVMTPELVQAIKILQLNTLELEAYTKEQIIENPVLEVEEPTEEEREKYEKLKQQLQEYGRDNSYNSEFSEYAANDREPMDLENCATEDISLKEHLFFQLQFLDLERTEKHIANFIIESLDDRGYMTASIDEIADKLNVSTDEVERVHGIVRKCEPIGVAAESLCDCLKMQLKAKDALTEELRIILDDYLEMVADNRLSVIARELEIPVLRVQELVDFIKTLHPAPGIAFGTQEIVNTVSPDIFIYEENGELKIDINESASPRLFIAPFYKKMLEDGKNDPELLDFLVEKMNSATWLIKSIEQRKNTIRQVVESIVERQREFFYKGEKHIDGMTLKDVAEDIGVHESTVSRTVNGKYLSCKYGVFELKYFFTSGVGKADKDGAISSNSVKTYLKEIIANEDEKKPYSDQRLADMLKERNIAISRRTVAKYRDEAGILSSSKRRRY